MKIYISYSGSDSDYANALKKHLIEQNHEVLDIRDNQKSAQSIFAMIEDKISEAEFLISINSKSSARSKHHRRELSAMKILADTITEKNLLVVYLDRDLLPDLSLSKYHRIRDKRTNNDFRIFDGVLERFRDKSALSIKEDIEEKSESRHISDLRSALDGGRLTLVCGAGVSIGAKIPPWSDLLDRLLDAMVTRLTTHSKEANAAKSGLRDIRDSSSLIAGRYLKSVFQDDFSEEVRLALYRDVMSSCDIIDAIVDLARPRRSRSHLDSIISFNFDDLLERNFEISGIEHRAIFKEGSRNRSTELPVFHVHGYLPHKGRIDKESEIVFSEDAYHDQFVDPFSWSNITQINKYTQNTCLFVGLSMTDPNLRRLLDVSRRRDKKGVPRHYVILKRDEDSSRNRMMESLREQDAAGLGLSIIWIDSFEDIPELIRQISGEPNYPSSAH